MIHTDLGELLNMIPARLDVGNNELFVHKKIMEFWVEEVVLDMEKIGKIKWVFQKQNRDQLIIRDEVKKELRMILRFLTRTKDVE